MLCFPRDVHQARDGSRSVSCHVTAQDLFDSWHTYLFVRHSGFHAAVHCGTKDLKVCPRGSYRAAAEEYAKLSNAITTQRYELIRKTQRDSGDGLRGPEYR